VKKQMHKRDLSIIIPAYNESESIAVAVGAVTSEFPEAETIVVDDGSTDETAELAIHAGATRVIRLSHSGQGKAVYEGIMAASHRTIATLDADLQNDPADIRRMYDKLIEGWDMVCGWRRTRQDGSWKVVSSRIGNFVARNLLGSPVHDNVCPLKVFDKSCISDAPYFDYFHRYIPYLYRQHRICEVEVTHYPRKFGHSHYGTWDRIVSNIRTIRWIKRNGL